MAFQTLRGLKWEFLKKIFYASFLLYSLQKKNVVPRATVTPAGDSIFLLKLFSLHARDVHIFRTLTA